jgi:hypothetical protein
LVEDSISLDRKAWHYTLCRPTSLQDLCDKESEENLNEKKKPIYRNAHTNNAKED